MARYSLSNQAKIFFRACKVMMAQLSRDDLSGDGGGSGGGKDKVGGARAGARHIFGSQHPEMVGSWRVWG